MNNLCQQYKEQSLSTLAPGELLVKLFDEAILQMRRASLAIGKRNISGANDNLTKAQTIITTLAGSLDMRYPISNELKDMYIFIAKQIHQANMKKDAAIIDETVPLLKDLRDSFEQAEKLSRKSQFAGKQAI